MKKRFFAVLTAILLLCACLPLCAVSVSAATYGYLTYEIKDGKVTITDCDENATTVVIPSRIEGKPVTAIDMYAFAYCYSLKSVTIPDSVTHIGPEAFYYCESLTSVTIPDGITAILYATFAYCNSLTLVTIPDSVTSIGNYAFYHNGSSLMVVNYTGTEEEWEKVSKGDSVFPKNCLIGWDDPKYTQTVGPGGAMTQPDWSSIIGNMTLTTTSTTKPTSTTTKPTSTTKRPTSTTRPISTTTKPGSTTKATGSSGATATDNVTASAPIGGSDVTTTSSTTKPVATNDGGGTQPTDQPSSRESAALTTAEQPTAKPTATEDKAPKAKISSSVWLWLVIDLMAVLIAMFAILAWHYRKKEQHPDDKK